MSALPLIISAPAIGALVVARAPAALARPLALAVSLLSAAVAVAHAAAALTDGQLAEAALSTPLAGTTLALRVDDATAWWSAACALVGVWSVASAARRAATPERLALSIATTSALQLGLLAGDLPGLVLGWAASAWLPRWMLASAHGDADAGVRRAHAWLAVATSAPPLLALCLVVALAPPGAQLSVGAPLPISRGAEAVVFALLAAAILARAATLPLHGWLARLAERGPADVVLLMVSTGLPLHALSTLVLGDAGEHFAARAPLVGGLGLATAAFGAGLSLVQRDLRRAIAVVAIAQSGLGVAALALGGPSSAAAASRLSVATSLAVAGLVVIASAVAARTGTTALARLGGLARSMPIAAWGAVALSLAVAATPGFVAFGAEHAVAASLASAHPLALVLFLASSGAAAIGLFSATLRAFFGPTRPGLARTPELAPRERRVVIACVAVLALSSLLPEGGALRPQVASVEGRR